jgi:transcriptional regulator of acetoin/glycerol metabolism
MAGAEDAELTATTTAGKGEGTLNTILSWVHPPGAPASRLTESTTVMGRDPGCGVQLGTQRVSRRHAEVVRRGGRHTVRDLDSKNGVFVNGRRVPESPLEPGDVLRLGNYVAIVQRVADQGVVGFHDLGHGIHGGPAISRALSELKALAARRETVLLVGERGVGKELFARALHRLGGRRGPFVIVRSQETSLAELAEDLDATGTAFFDDLSDLSSEIQAELRLRIQRGGGDRFVFASEAPLVQVLVRALDPALRSLLEERTVSLPALRHRRADIVPAFRRFLGARGEPPTLDPELVERLCLSGWPLNELELQTVARRLLATFPNLPELGLSELAQTLGSSPMAAPVSIAAAHPARPSTYPREQVAALKQAIKRHGGNLTKAASELGITRPKAYRILGMARDD